MNLRKGIKVGIDPDIHKSGFAVVEDNIIISIDCLNFFDLTYELDALSKIHLEMIVFLEDGRKNLPIFKRSDKQYVMIAVARRVGQQETIIKLIEEFCKIRNIDVQLVKPKSKKIDAKFFNAITGWEGRTNQEMRDAGMLAFLNSEL